MAPTVIVKSEDIEVRARREAGAQRVIAQFGNQLPDLKLLCFLDDSDWRAFKDHFGEANRGFYGPIKENSFCRPTWPDYVIACIFADDPSVWVQKPAFEHVIYLYDSTCTNEVGLTVTFAHELQHFVQHGSELRLWAANTLIPQLPKSVINALGLKWCDIPHEREARIVSKRTAENLFGCEVVRQYIDAKIAEFVTREDALDWECIRGLVASTPYDLAGETQRIFQRLKDYRLELEQLLQEVRSDPDFEGVDLHTLLGGASG